MQLTFRQFILKTNEKESQVFSYLNNILSSKERQHALSHFVAFVLQQDLVVIISSSDRVATHNNIIIID